MKRILLPFLCFCALTSWQANAADAPIVTMKTSEGTLRIQLDPRRSPITVANFLSYVESGHYAGTIFHRVIPGFMIQGGGFTDDFEQKPTQAPIKNESSNRVSNLRGTIAMARTQAPDSATAQFFINVSDNPFLDSQMGRVGYAVFGRVIEGMDVADKIVNIPTGTFGSYRDVPSEIVYIESVSVEEADADS